MRRIEYILFTIIILLGINIKPVYAGVNLSCDEMKIGINTTKTLGVSGASGKLTWASSDDGIVSVSNGMITGNSLGTAYISAMDNNSTATCKVTVISDYVAVTGLTPKNSEETVGVNETVRITATISPSNATNKSITYASSDNSVAAVDSNGVVTGKKAGTTYISLSLEGKSVNVKVTVVSNVSLKGITINPSTITIDEGKTSKLSVTYNPSNATNKKVTWKSSNTSVVTVDDSGNLKAVASGTATITVISNDGGHVGTVKVTVNALDKTLKGISLSKKEVTLKVGESDTLTVKYDPANADKKNVTWKSSDRKVVSVEDGKITALKPGSAEITVTSDEGNFSAVCKVKVPSPPIEAIKFKDEEIEVTEGDTVSLETVSTPEDAIILDAIWTSSDDAVATVKDGVLKALKVGTTEVTVSDKEGKIKATVKVNVIEKVPDLVITVSGYELNFDPDKKDYTLEIGNESSLSINVNRDTKKYKIEGNRDLQNGSLITITVLSDDGDKKYVISISKKGNYTMYFIGAIGLLLVINIIRIIIRGKKKKM